MLISPFWELIVNLKNLNDYCRDIILDYLKYRNVPKFSDRQVWANSVEPDQTALRGAV